jgi:hypothetical protein
LKERPSEVGISHDVVVSTDSKDEGRTFSIFCPQALSDLWRAGEINELANLWSLQYPGLFDEVDLHIAQRQRPYHFPEWFTAVHLFQREGARSMVEKYDQPKSHPGKYARYERVTTKEQRRDLLHICEEKIDGDGVQLPDLFVTALDESEFWFAEIKGPGDKLSKRQLISHERIRSLGLRVDTLIMHVIAG